MAKLQFSADNITWHEMECEEWESNESSIIEVNNQLFSKMPEIISLLSEGYTVKEIAAKLGITISALQNMIRQERARRKCKNVAHLIGDYYRRHIIQNLA